MQDDRPVERPAVALVGRGRPSGPVVAGGDRDLVAEEPGPLGAGMGDQRLVRRQVQLEVVTQELRQAVLDLLGFGLGSGEPEQGVVGVTAVAQPAGSPDREGPGWAGCAAAGKATAPAARSPVRRAWAIACSTRGTSGLRARSLPRVYSGIRTFSTKDVQLVQVNVREDGRCDAALRRTAEGSLPTSSPPGIRPSACCASAAGTGCRGSSPTGSRPSPHGRAPERSQGLTTGLEGLSAAAVMSR